MKKRRPAWTHLIMFIVVATVLGVAPLLFMDASEFIARNGFLGYFYFGFCIFIGGACLIEMVRLYIGERRENRLLRGDESATRTKATFLNSKFKTSTEVNGRVTHSYHHVRYGYKDEYGNYVTRQSFKLYSPLEVEYLSSLGEFDVLMKGKVAVIVEDLDEQVIANYFNNRRSVTSTGDDFYDGNGNYGSF